jgi:hypothetical protein
VAPHAFDPEPDSADFFGRQVCRHCHLLGEPGDHRHPHGALPPPELPPALADAARARDAAVLGEKGHHDA